MKEYEDQLLDDWESVFRQGLLSYWVFLSIENEAKTVSEIRDAISKLTKGTYQTSEQTLYRSLRKFYDLELVDYTEIATPGAPKRKLYILSEIGKKVFSDFCRRNIALFLQDAVIKHIHQGDKP